MIAKPFGLDDLLSQIAAALDTRLDCAEQEQARVVCRYFELLGAREWEALGALCTPDVVYALPGDSPYSTEVRGVQAFCEYTAAIFAHFPNATFDGVSIYSTPNGLAARYQGRWTTPDGEQQQAGAVTFRFEGERIAQIGVQLDTARLQALAGVPKL
jgi:ketosteroid isomerase-like protein